MWWSTTEAVETLHQPDEIFGKSRPLGEECDQFGHNTPKTLKIIPTTEQTDRQIQAKTCPLDSRLSLPNFFYAARNIVGDAHISRALQAQLAQRVIAQ
ncbi:MAG: hypothetical protein DHS20C16_20100 [Phycisphaerae bacterium]|nr:MAG: hypothetical protein DHS20C16_20100 [Phycisphaerae bacterium]